METCCCLPGPQTNSCQAVASWHGLSEKNQAHVAPSLWLRLLQPRSANLTSKSNLQL